MLSGNFRSRPAVLAAVNEVGRMLLDGFAATVVSNDIEENDRIFWVAEREIHDCGLPTVFKKFAKLMLPG